MPPVKGWDILESKCCFIYCLLDNRRTTGGKPAEQVSDHFHGNGFPQCDLIMCPEMLKKSFRYSLRHIELDLAPFKIPRSHFYL